MRGNREDIQPRVRIALLAAFAAAIGSGANPAAAATRASATSMYIESCSLGCSSGGGGTAVSCSFAVVHENTEIRIRFSHPVDPVTLSWTTFQLLDVNTGQSPIGARFVDASDPNVVVFRPGLSFDALGNPVFGFHPLTTYRIYVPGASQGDPPPYIVSFDLPHLPNRSRMQCDIQVAQGVDSPATPFCSGDGHDPAVTTPCPCSNFGSNGRGCANSSASSGGALLFALGATVPDSVVLFATYEVASAPTLFLQGDQQIAAGLAFGDGIRCAGGNLLRLAVKVAAYVTVVYPSAGDPSITARSAALGRPIGPGETRTYQAWYRDSDPSFCANPPGNQWNVTNGVRISW